MSILWFDSFDKYGTTAANMILGFYAELGYVQSITGTNPNTGSYALGFYTWKKGASNYTSGVRKVLSDTASTIGVGFYFRMDNLPTADDQSNCLTWLTSGNSNILTLGIQSDGTLVVRSGGYAGTILGDSGSNKITAGVYYHIETKIVHDATNGSIELRVNGITWIDESSVNTSSNPTGQLWIGSKGLNGGAGVAIDYARIDDLFVWDDQGSINNDFLGPRIVYFTPPNQDTAVADWSSTEGTGYDAIDETSQDGDTSYIYSSGAYDVSEFGLTDLDPAVLAVSAVMMFAVARKTDSGDGNMQLGLIGSSNVTLGDDNAMSTTYTYRSDIIETHPDTGSAITPTEYNSLKIRTTRTI